MKNPAIEYCEFLAANHSHVVEVGVDIGFDFKAHITSRGLLEGKVSIQLLNEAQAREAMGIRVPYRPKSKTHVDVEVSVVDESIKQLSPPKLNS